MTIYVDPIRPGQVWESRATGHRVTVLALYPEIHKLHFDSRGLRLSMRTDMFTDVYRLISDPEENDHA